MNQVQFAKVSRPKLVRVHPRPRLFRRLDRARGKRVVWIQGPPGAGKTTLVASWLAARRARAAWLQLDPGDADVAGFFGWLSEAAGTLPGVARRPLPAFAPEALAGPGAYARRFFRALCAASATPTMVVLDDYHELPAGSPVHAALREGVQELAEGCSVVVASRGEPPPDLARLAASGALEVIGADELALTPLEAKGIAKLHGFDGASSAAALERARGWAAGVVLLGAGASVGGGAPLRVFDYLAAEVLARSTAEERAVLLRAAILPQVTGTSAAVLSGNVRAEEILTGLSRRGYFTVRKAVAEPTFEFHDLFREFLLARAEAELGAEELRSLERAAARLVEERGDHEEAVELWARAGAWDELARLVSLRAAPLLNAGRAETVARWIDRLPPERVAVDPWLVYWRGAARFPRDAAGAIEAMTSAHERFVAAGDARGAYLAWAAAADMTVFGLDDVTSLDGLLARLPALRARFPAYPDPATESVFTASALAAFVHRQPGNPELRAYEERATVLALEPGLPAARLHVGRQLAMWTGYWASDLARARVIMDALAPLAEAKDVLAVDVILWHAADAQRRMYRGEREACLEAARRGLAVAAERGVAAWNPVLLASRAWGELLAGDLEAAARTTAENARAVQGMPRVAQVLYHQAAGTVALWQGELGAAIEHGDVAVRFSREVGMPLAESDCLLTRAVPASRTGDAAALPAALAAARAVANRYAEWAAILALADEALRAGNEAAALARAAEAFALGREGEFWFSVWLPRADLAELVALALEHGVEPAYAAELVRRCGLSPGPRAVGVEGWPWAIRIDALGGLAIVRNGAPDAPPGSGKVAKKPLELLRLLVALGPRGARLEALAESLWPDAEADAGQHALETTLYRLRKLLEDPQAVVQRGGRVALDASRVFVDAWAVERLLDRLEAMTQRGNVAAAAALSRRISRLWRGDLLEDEGDEPAVLAARKRLRERVTAAVPNVR